MTAVKRAQDSTRIVSTRPHSCVTSFFLELYMFITDGLQKQLLSTIVVGDISALYLRITALGQTCTIGTRRHNLNTLQKGTLNWPIYLQHSNDVCDTL